MAVNNFLPFAGGADSNVLTQTEYAALASRTAGFSSGVAKSAELNKVWRQASIMSSVLGQLINDMSGLDAIDDGSISTLLANLKTTIRAFNGIQRFTSSGSFTVPLGITKIYVSGCGAGGGGGYSGATSSSVSGGGGGGGAGQSIVRSVFTVTPGQVIAITIGAGGGSGGNGGDTVVGSLVTLFGGSAGGNGIPSHFGTPAGGLGGSGYPKGGDGSDTSANVLGTGNAGSGGSGPFGGGGGGARSTGAGAPLQGGNGGGFGSGGGGSGGVTVAGTFAAPLAGIGGSGLVIIEW